MTQDAVSYLTVAQVRAEYGEDVADDADEKIQRRIDQLAAYVEDALGHTFGRALVATSPVNSLCAVTATELTIGGVSYPFATYLTLQDLVTAVNAAGAVYSLELLPNVRSDTPSTLLGSHAATACGPNYNDRVVLPLSALYYPASGQGHSHTFLPLNVASVVAVAENGVALEATDYYSAAGESWLVRKGCGCLFTNCHHVPGHWSGAYPHNIAVVFVPQYWGHVPGAVASAVLEAYEARGGLSPYAQEDFGDYSYRRKTAPVVTWQDVLGAGNLRKYATKFMP